MPALRSWFAVLLAAVAPLAACTVAAVDFTELDASENADAGVDAPPGELMLVVSATSVQVDELGESTFDVSLSQPPGGPVFVTVQASDESVLGARPNLLVFEPATWDDPQRVTVSGKDDADLLDDSGSVSLTSTVTPDVAVTVTVNDTDALEIVTTPVGAVQVDEGATTPIAVTLSAMPAADVVVEIASLDSGVAAVAPGTLTFTASNWSTPQDVLVTGVQDPETDHEDTNIGFSSPGSPEVDATTLMVHVIDDDVLNIFPSSTNLGILGEGATTSFTVRMTRALTADLDVTISSSDAGALGVSPATLRFTSTTWDVPQTVTVTVPQDPDVTDETPTIDLAAPGVTTRVVTAAIDDDDVQQIVLAPAAATVVEGATTPFAVRLAYQPAAPITVSVNSLATSVATVTPASLTFTPTDYADPQTVVVRGTDDQDAAVGTTAIHFESLAPPLMRDAAVTVMDDDPLAIETDVMSVSLTESTSATFQVRLRAAPVGSLDVLPISADVSTATVSPAMLTFTASNWNAYQTVTVTGVDDADVATEMIAISLGSSATQTVTVTANVMDIDQQTIVASAPSLTVTEGTTGTITVRLQYQPAANVVVAAASSAPAAATVSPASLTFTPSNFATPQSLTITGVDDADIADGAATITLSSAGLPSVTVAVTVDDPDVLAILPSPTTLTINEASSGSIGVRLTAQPASNVSVSVASSDPSAATASPATLAFTPGNWSTAQTVTVAGVDDADVSSESVVVMFGAAGIPSATATVSVTDDDPLNILTSVGSVAMTEPGNATFQVRLSQMPPSNVTVNVASADTGAATVSPASLAFTTSNWNTYQTVTVQSVNDVDLANESVAIDLTGAGLMPASVTAAVTDEDLQSIQLSTTSLTVLEGASLTVTARLAFQPAANVVVTSSSANAAVATATPATLTFTPANYATPQTLTITGVEDPDAAAGMTTVSLATPGVPTVNVAVTVSDNDPLDITTSVAAVTVGETATGTVGVKLTAQPAANVTVNVASSDTGAATATPASLTFTTANWDTFQNVTLTGVDDADAAAESVTLTLSGNGVTTRTVAVSVVDNDPLTIVTSVGAVALTENGTATFTVRLGAQPPASTTVSVTSADTGAATVSPASLSFTTASWDTAQTVTVTGFDDVDLVDEAVALSLAASGIPTVMVTANVDDPDQQQVIATPSTLSVNEGGSGSVSVRLAYQPAGNVVVTASVDAAIATSTPGTLTFTPSNWSTNQGLTIAGVQDGDGVNDTTSLSLTATGVISASVGLTVVDDDPLTIVTNVGALTVTEGGTATFSVRLSAQPSATTAVSVSSGSTGDATVSPSQLSFTTTNWNTYQTVTVTGVQDADGVNESVTVTATASGWMSESVTVTVYDNDIISTDVSSLSIIESGATGTLQVRLSAQPSASVTVTIASSDTGALTVSPSTRTFSTSNWNTYQTVTLTGVNDTDATNEPVTLSLTATGYTTATVAATVFDNDTLESPATSFTVGEGDPHTLMLRLKAPPPNGSAVVTVTSQDTSIVTVSPSTRTFTSSNWNTYQSVTVTGVVDADEITNENTTVLLTTNYTNSLPVYAYVQEYYTVTIQPSTDNGGTGTVTGPGINCSVPGTGDCTERKMYGSTLALHAAPAPGQAFWGWTNCEPWWDDDCTVTVNNNVTVRSQFPRTVDLTVTKTGSGLVKDADYTAIDCGTQCTWAYHWPVVGIRMQATASPGWSFAYWTGACQGQGALCTLSFDVPTSTHAVFTSP